MFTKETAVVVPLLGGDYAKLVATEAAILVLFAASLHFMMGPGGLASFGHAAYFGVGAYAAALLSTPGALKIGRLDIAFDNRTRACRITYQVSTIFGDTAVTTVEV